MSERNLFNEIQSGLIEIRDHPEKLRRIEVSNVIEIGISEDGLQLVTCGEDYLGYIGKLASRKWIALPLSVGTRNRYIKHSVHKLRRDAITALH